MRIRSSRCRCRPRLRCPPGHASRQGPDRRDRGFAARAGATAGVHEELRRKGALAGELPRRHRGVERQRPSGSVAVVRARRGRAHPRLCVRCAPAAPPATAEGRPAGDGASPGALPPHRQGPGAAPARPDRGRAWVAATLCLPMRAAAPRRGQFHSPDAVVVATGQPAIGVGAPEVGQGACELRSEEEVAQELAVLGILGAGDQTTEQRDVERAPQRT